MEIDKFLGDTIPAGLEMSAWTAVACCVVGVTYLLYVDRISKWSLIIFFQSIAITLSYCYMIPVFYFLLAICGSWPKFVCLLLIKQTFSWGDDVANIQSEKLNDAVLNASSNECCWEKAEVLASEVS